METMSDSEFINFISTNNYNKSIFRIDSLLKNNTYSTHKSALLYFEKGTILGIIEKDIEAIGSLNKALEFFTKEDNQLYIAKTNMLLSDSNAYIFKNTKAASHVTVALQIFRKLNDKNGEAKALNSLGHIEFQQKNYIKSIQHVKQAAQIQEKLQDTATLSASYNNIGFILEQIKDIENAKEYYKKAIELNNKTNRKNTNALRNLGYVYLLENKTEKSKDMYLKALDIEKQTGVHSIQKEVYDVLLQLSIKDKNFKNSSLYITKRDSLNQLITKIENEEKIKLIEDQYSLITKESELKQQIEINNKNRIIFIIVAGSLFLFGLFLFQRHKNSELKLNQDKLILEQKVLRTQMNPHFIFNALTSIQKSVFDNNPMESATYLSRFAKLIRQNFEFVNKKEIFLSEDLDALKNYIETQQLRFDNKFNYLINIAKDIDPTYTKIPPMLLQPFVENAIEHGLKSKTEKGNLTIDITKKEGLFCFKIIDDGIGIQEENKNKNREHAIDIFKKRLTLRKLGEEKRFKITTNKNTQGTIITFYLNLN